MSVALQEREALLQGLLSYMGGAEMWGRDRKWAGDFLETRNRALRDQKEKKRRENSGVCFTSHGERLLQGMNEARADAGE